MSTNFLKTIFVVSNGSLCPLKGGGGVRVSWVINSLVKSSNKIKVIGLFDNFDNKNFDKCKIFSLGRSGRFKSNKELRYLIQMIKIFFILLFNKFDIVYAHNIVAALPSLFVAKIKRKKIVFDMDDILTGLSDVKLVRYFGSLIEFFVARNSNITIAMSEALKNELKKHGVKKVVKVFHGVDIEKFIQPRRKISSVDKTQINLVYMGGIEKHDGTILIPLALKKIIKETNNLKININILGQGAESDNLKKIIGNNHLKKYFTFHNWINQDEIPQFLAQQDIGLVTHLKNPATDICLVLKGLEYMACGLPVIAPKLKGMKEEIGDDERGLLFKAGDSNDLAKKIMYLVNHQNQWQKIRNNANIFIRKNANWEINADKITKICLE